MCTEECRKACLEVPACPLEMGESPDWWPAAPDLRRWELTINFQGKDYIGYMVAPPASAGKKPMVIIVHNFQGLKFFDVHQAEYMARLGYVGLAIDMWDREVVPPSARLVPPVNPEDPVDPEFNLPPNILAWLRAAFTQMVEADHDFPRLRAHTQAWLDVGLAHEAVDESLPPAIMGYCYGGMVVIEAVRGGLNLSGAMSLHGLLQAGWDPNPERLAGVKRKPLVTCENKYNTKTVLIIENGMHDDLVPQWSIDKFQEEMEAAGVDWRFHTHGHGAGHGFALPKTLGGPGHLHDLADRRSTMDLLVMLKEVWPGVPQNRVEKNAAGTVIPAL